MLCFACGFIDFNVTLVAPFPRLIKFMQARSKQCMIGPAEINIKLLVGGLGRAASSPAGSGAQPREPNAFQQKYNENGFKLLTIGGEQACCRTVALLYTPKSDCVVSAVKTKLRPARLLVRPKPDQPDRLLRPCYAFGSLRTLCC